MSAPIMVQTKTLCASIYVDLPVNFLHMVRNNMWSGLSSRALKTEFLFELNISVKDRHTIEIISTMTSSYTILHSLNISLLSGKGHPLKTLELFWASFTPLFLV